MRGTVLDYVPRVGVSGITPACAGNRLLRFARIATGEDHPRVCGEQAMTYEEAIGVEDHPRVCGEQGHIVYDNPGRGGSPPRVRGTVT